LRQNHYTQEALQNSGRGVVTTPVVITIVALGGYKPHRHYTSISNNKGLYVPLPSRMSDMTTVIICIENDGITIALQVTLTHLWNTRDR
jgi:hypothetical protein